jgi:hypothetical protein
MFAALPLLALPVLFYNIMALTLKGGFGSLSAQVQLASPLFVIPIVSGAVWSVNLGDLILAGALVVLFVELLKSTNSQKAAIVNHSLSMLLFVVCLIEFLLAPAFATSTFFLLTLMVLLDVLAGFIVTIMSARKDVDFHDGN